MFSYYPVLYTGDDTDAIVFEHGSANFRCGFSGTEYPLFETQPCVGKYLSSAESKYKYLVGDVALNRLRMATEVDWVIKDGIIEDWDGMEKLIDKSYSSWLRTKSTQHPVFFVEPASNPKPKQQRLCELMFEQFQIPSIQFGKAPGLACLSLGVNNGFVIDAGYHGTTLCPVEDGYALNRAGRKSICAGKYLEDEILKMLGVTDDLTPVQLLKRNGKKYLVEWEDLRASMVNYFQRKLLDDISRSVINFRKETHTGDNGIEYNFPNGSTRKFSTNHITERYFSGETGIPKLAIDCVLEYDIDYRQVYFNNIVCVGGLTMLPHFCERLQKELNQQKVGEYRKRAIIPRSILDRRYAAFKGASILASVGQSSGRWLSREMYAEYGTQAVYRYF